MEISSHFVLHRYSDMYICGQTLDIHSNLAILWLLWTEGVQSINGHTWIIHGYH